MTESDSEGVPDLVESSDEESSRPIYSLKPSRDFVDVWLKKSERFLDRQDSQIHVLCLGPFLLGLNSFVPEPWIQALKEVKLLEGNRETEITALTWSELESTDLVEQVFLVMQKKLRSPANLTACLDLLDKVEEKMIDKINVDKSIELAESQENIIKMWKKMNKSSLCKKNEKQTKFATIYVAKIYHIVVIGVGRDSRDVTDEFKRNRRKIQSVDPAKYKDAGNEQYQHGKYETAADYYTKAAKADPFNHIFFGNRAQTYNKLKRHDEALSDGRRAITLKPDYCKGHYRYAQALADFDKLDYAIAVNKKGYILCKKSRNKNISETNLNELEQQGKRLCLERDTRIREERIRLVLENKEYGDRFIEEELPAEVRNLPGEKRVIKLHDLLRKPDSPDVEIPDVLSSESSSEEEVENIEKQPTNDTIRLSETCQRYDSLTEDLKKLTEKWERDKNQMAFDRELLAYKQKLQLDSLGQKLALGIPTLGSLTKAVEEAEENDENEEGNTNQNALTKKEKKKKGNKKNKKKEEVAKPVKQKKESSPVVNKEAVELQRYLGEAYDRHTKGEPQNASTEYSKALKLMADHNLKQLNIEKVEIVTTKYAFGITAISTGNFELIMDGIEKFNDIRSRHSDTRFPLANYGLGKAYTLLNRYSQAVDPVKQGLHMVENQKCVSFYWPGTTIIIEESVPETLQTLLNELLQLALNPPPPDATCRIHCDTEDDRVVIYQTDPDYKGFVRVFCESKCKVEFHYNCWRVFKSRIGEKIGDKEMLDKSCPTPNCGTVIVKISIYRKGTREKHFESEKMEISKKQEKKKKAAQKTQPTGGQEKMTKAEKKGKKKTEAKEEKSGVMDDVNQMLHEQDHEKVDAQRADLAGGGDRMEEEVKFPDHTHPVSVLRKDDEDMKFKYKGTKKQKNKKKKEKAVKATIPVEVNFTDDREKHLLNEHSIPDSPTRDFSVPTNIHEKVQAFESTYESKQVPVQYVYDQITENLFSFFEDLLKAHGPLHVEDTKITSMIEDFPADAKVKIEQVGGLSNFLKQSLKFAMINDFVCLLKDSVKARHLSLARENARQMISNSVESSDNVWKTVGKHTGRSEFVTDQFSLSGNAPVDNVLSEDKIKAVFLNPYSMKSSGVDSLDDFGDVVKKSSVADLDDDFDLGPMRSGSKMDKIDEIHLISPSKKKKKTKNKFSVKDLDDIDSFSSSSGSDSDSLCEDDTGSLNSELSSIKSGKASSSHKAQVENGRIADLKQNLDISSRSSSKSDLSEKSGNDLSYELMAKAYRNSPVASLYMKEKSPSLSENGRSADKSLHGLAFPQPLKLPTQLTQRPPAMSLQLEASIAAEKEIDRIDNEMVKEIADDVMQRLMFGKNVSFAERQETYNRVTQDIWKDFNKQRSASSSSVWSLDNKSLYTQMSPGSLDSRQRKNYAEQFMKSHYQNNTTDPLHEKPSISPSPSTFPYPSQPPISTVNNNFPTLRPPQGGPPPLSLPTSFSSVNSYTSNITYPSVNPSIWSSHSGSTVSEGIPSMTSFSAPPPPLNLPSFPPGPFGSLSIGTSLTEPSVSTLSSVFGSHSDQCVQVCVQTRDAETITEPYEQAEYIRSVRECEMLKATVTKLQNQMSEREAMLREWTKRAQSLENNSQQLEMGKKELEEKLRVYEQEVNRLNLDLHAKSTAILELREKINHTEQRCVDLQKQQHDERYRTSQLDQEKSEVLRNREELKKLQEEESQRAKRAEVDLLQVKKNFALQMLERSKMEYMAYKNKVSQIAKRREDEGKSLPDGLKQHLVQYEGILKICEETISRLKMEFDDHIRQVQGGRKMSELQPIFIPPPPPQPQMPNLDMLTGHTMTSVASAPSLLALGSGALSGGVKSSPSPPLSSSQQAASNILPPSIPSAQSAPQPKPLGLPTGLQGSQRPLMTPSINPMIPSLSQGMMPQPQHKTSNFDKLIMKLQVAFPQYSRAIFTQLIQELRTKRGGSLSGMTLDEIVSQITDLIHHHEVQQGRNPSVVATIPKEMGFGDDRAKNPPPGLLGTWGMSGTDLVGLGVSSEVFEEEEDPCVICHEEMTPPTTVMLECKHRFHDECIRKWLREQSTCPNCRIHALLPDEFPSLR